VRPLVVRDEVRECAADVGGNAQLPHLARVSVRDLGASWEYAYSLGGFSRFHLKD
jgi:hypothetical protein